MLRSTRRMLILLVALGLAAPAAAEIRFEGDARMGVVRSPDPGAGAGAPNRWRFDSRIRATVRMERETDGGLRVGAQLRLDQAQNALRGHLTPRN